MSTNLSQMFAACLKLEHSGLQVELIGPAQVMMVLVLLRSVSFVASDPFVQSFRNVGDLAQPGWLACHSLRY
jgi:hypothetical protein